MFEKFYRSCKKRNKEILFNVVTFWRNFGNSRETLLEIYRKCRVNFSYNQTRHFEVKYINFRQTVKCMNLISFGEIIGKF